MTSEIEIRIRNDAEAKSQVRDVLGRFSEANEISAEVMRAFDLALEEHLTNIMAYGYEDALPHEICIRFDRSGSGAKVTVEDDGRPFNPLEHPGVDTSLPLSQKPVGGLGIHMMRQVLDRLDYERTGGKNRVTFYKEDKGRP